MALSWSLSWSSKLVSGVQDRSYDPSKTLQWLQFFPEARSSSIVDVLLIFMNMQIRLISYRPRLSIG